MNVLWDTLESACLSVLPCPSVDKILVILCRDLPRFLAPLAFSQRAIVMALCRLCVRPFVYPSVHAWVCKLFLQKTSPQKLLTGFLAPLAVGQRAYVMVRFPLCVRPCVNFFFKHLLL